MLVYNRDFVLSKAVVRRDGVILANHVSTTHPDAPEQKGFVRGEIYATGYYIIPVSDNESKCVYVIQLDPKGVRFFFFLFIFIYFLFIIFFIVINYLWITLLLLLFFFIIY